MKKVNLISAIVAIFVIGALLLFKKINNDVEGYRSKAYEHMIKTECEGAVEEIDDRQATIYFIVAGEKYSFSTVGRYEMYGYVENGDSIIKQADSKIVRVKKQDGSEKEFLLR